MMSAKQTNETFWAKVNRDYNNFDKCWEWQGACNSTGYGTVAWHGKVYTSHRIAAWLSGLIKDPNAPQNKRSKTHVLHKCDNRKCCNPNHFFLGNYTDNQVDAYSKNRKTQRKGERHVNSKLTNQEASLVRKLYEKGETQVELAKKFKVSQRSISLIVRKETYK